jgi:hypothetical protein
VSSSEASTSPPRPRRRRRTTSQSVGPCRRLRAVCNTHVGTYAGADDERICVWPHLARQCVPAGTHQAWRARPDLVGTALCERMKTRWVYECGFSSDISKRPSFVRSGAIKMTQFERLTVMSNEINIAQLWSRNATFCPTESSNE